MAKATRCRKCSELMDPDWADFIRMLCDECCHAEDEDWGED